MSIRFLRYTRPVAGIAALGILAACSSDTTGTNSHMVKLSFTTNTSSAAAANRVAADLSVGPAGELVLQRVQLVFGKIELDRAGTADCIGEIEANDGDHGGASGNDDRGRGDEECEDVSRDPIFVDLPVDATLHTAVLNPLAAGTFSQLEAKLEPAKVAATVFNTAHPEIVGKSVRVVGKFHGIDFVFTSAMRTKLEMEFDPPLVIDATTKNATISLDVSKWFLTSSGAVIDPSTATPGSNNQQQIEQNIRRSFHAFEDDNERGEDHHEGHHGNGDGR